MENNKRIKTFTFLRKEEAYRIEDKSKRYDYLYIRGQERGVMMKWKKEYILYDYELKENIIMGDSMLKVVRFIKNFYKL